MTRDLHNLNLLAELMALLRQISFNLPIAAIAEAILMRIFAEQVLQNTQRPRKNVKHMACNKSEMLTMVSCKTGRRSLLKSK